MGKNRFSILHTDVLSAFKTMPDNSYHGCLTDPPYGLTTDGGKTGFMGHAWDHGVPSVDVWRELLRVLRPGAHVLAFGGTRTFHRLTCAIEDAGFEIRDCMMWLYGCLSDDTEVLVDGQWEHYSKATAGRLALCYDVANGTYSWQPIAERVEYDYDETAYRITSERTDQIVSRNHRCIVDNGRGWEFSLAEESARKSAVVVPILKDVQGLLGHLRDAQQNTSTTKYDVLDGVPSRDTSPPKAAERAQGSIRNLCGVLEGRLEAERVASQGKAVDVLERVQWEDSRRGVGEACPQGPTGLDTGLQSLIRIENVRTAQPSVEGRSDLLRIARESRGCEVRTMPGSVPANGTEGRLRDGAPACGCASDGAATAALRSGPPHGSQSSEQRGLESGSVRHELGSQAVRGEGFTTSDLAVIEPVHYTGKVWCLRVPTGAFVARRNGKVFVTGNSGFPKSHDVSKALDREAGAVREAVGVADRKASLGSGGRLGSSELSTAPRITAPATEAARQYAGHGTALKPAWEPIIVARKPLEGTVAQNVQAHGCGGLAIDACRVGTGGGTAKGSFPKGESVSVYGNGISGACEIVDIGKGRWPANVILDGVEDPVLRLRDNVDQQVARIIRLYFCGMPDVRSGDPNVPESGEPEEVLRERLLREVAKREPKRSESPHGRKAAPSRFPGEDAGDKEGPWALESGTELCQLEGRNVPDARLPNGGNESGGPGAIRRDGESVRLCDGAPAGDGSQAGAPTDFQGSGSPQKRHEDGQQDTEPRAFGQRDAQAGAPSDHSGASAPEARERAIEVRASQVPEGWLSYFEPTGRVISGEAGQVLDSQTGTLRNGGQNATSRRGSQSVAHGGYTDGAPTRFAADSGGASRFFYQAKASKAERNAGVEANIHPTVKPLALARYLARLILPPIPDARMVVPFCGSGSEVIGALQAGWSHVDGIDSWDVAVDIARARVKHWNKPVEQLDLTGEE